MIGLPLLLLTGLALLWLAGVVGTVWMLTHPPRRTYGAAVARGRPGDPSELPSGSRPFETWSFRSRGLDLPVWDIAGDEPSGPVLIMTHGWGDSRVGALVRVEAVLPVVSRVLAWDLPGHGESRGGCHLGTAEVDDLLALIEHIHPARLVLMGWSLGAGVSIAAAGRIPASISLLGIIAEAPYRLPGTPAANVLRARGLPAGVLIPPAFLVLRACTPELKPSRFDRAKLAAALHVSLLVIHGADDAVCPVEDGRDIAAPCRGTMLEVLGGRHNDLWTDDTSLAASTKAVQEFIKMPDVYRPSGA